ncbi:retrovirus-related pol polyprotein from transposon TNT 1-94 [Tanacetum coccineum]
MNSPVSSKQTTSHSAKIQKPEIKVYSRKPKNVKNIGCPNCTLVLDSGCSKHMTGIRSQLMNFVSKFLVAFRKNTCFIRNLEGVDLLSGYRDTNLYIISLDDMLKSSLICLLSKASKTKSWLWHRRLSYLNFDNGTEFVNQTLREWYENVGITHQTSLARTPQQNGVVERQNGTLVEAARYFLKLHYFSGPKLSIQLVTPKTIL